MKWCSNRYTTGELRLQDHCQTAWSVSIDLATHRKRNILNDSYRTDVILFYPPYIVALAALLIAQAVAKVSEFLSNLKEQRDISKWLSSLRVDTDPVRSAWLSQLTQQIREVAKEILDMYDRHFHEKDREDDVVAKLSKGVHALWPKFSSAERLPNSNDKVFESAKLSPSSIGRIVGLAGE